MLTNERSGGSNFLKTGTQIQRYLLAQKTEDKPKNVVLNKRVRSSVVETKVCLQQDFEICSLFVAFTFLFFMLQFVGFLECLHLVTQNFVISCYSIIFLYSLQ